MGWLGHTEKETLDMSLRALEMAHRGRFKMLQAAFGASDEVQIVPKVPSADSVMSRMREIFAGIREK